MHLKFFFLILFDPLNIVSLSTYISIYSTANRYFLSYGNCVVVFFFFLHSNGMKKHCKIHIHTFKPSATSRTTYRIKCIKAAEEKKNRNEWTNYEICRNLNEFINNFFSSFLHINSNATPSVPMRMPNAERQIPECSPEENEQRRKEEKKKLFNCQTI